MRVLVSWAIGRSRKVIVLSQHIRDEVRRFYPRFDPGRIIVLHPGCGDEYRNEPEPGDREVLARHGLTPGYVLSVSSIHPRKNIAGLLRAYAWARHQGTLLPQLVLVGQKYWGASSTAGDAAEFNTRWLGFVPHGDLPAIYRGARLFAYPSLYEGFGLPPLEAMASGVPVVCGDNSSLPEAVGDAGLLVDVSRPEPLGNALMRLYGDEDLRRELIERGIARANRFRWLDTARDLVNALLADPDTPVKPQNTKDNT
jgi:glycosyltransferase involved in cell wall biosynthesis